MRPCIDRPARSVNPRGCLAILVFTLAAVLAIIPAFDTARAGQPHDSPHPHAHCMLHGTPAVLAEAMSLRIEAASHARLPFERPDGLSVRSDSVFVPPRL